MESTKHLKSIVNEESNRLEVLCNKWENVLETSLCISDEVKDQIRSVVGQTKLLIKEKLQQFRDLIKNYESGLGDINVTENDLEGFWDLVSIQVYDNKIQVTDLNAKFSQLDVINTGHKNKRR